MKFVLLCGPQAVGKMTVGKELEALTGLKLFHNHMTLELTSSIFGWGREECRDLSDTFRMEIFKAVARSDMSGLIFTFVWDFDNPEDGDYVETIFSIFREKQCEIYVVERETTLEIRMERNKTALRLEEKPSKRNIEFSEKELLATHTKFRLNSKLGEIKEKNYLRIDNTYMSPEETAAVIVEKFDL